MKKTERLIMKYTVTIITLVLLFSLCSAQAPDETTQLLPHPVYQRGRAVYINRLGVVVLTTPFSHGYSFSEGLARFSENDKAGFINEKGQIAIKPSFDGVGDFSEGFAAIEVNDKWGFIDKTGNRVIKPQFDSVNPFSEGLALIEMYVGDYPDGDDIYKCGYINKTGKIVIGRTGSHVVIKMRMFTSPKFDDGKDFSEGLAAVRVRSKWGYVNKQGQFAIPLRFEGAKNFSEGLAPVTYDGVKWGYIDKSGKLIVKPEFADAESFSEGLAPIAVYRSGNKQEWGYIDRSGRIVVEPQFYGAEPFREGLASILEPSRGGFGFIDRSGKLIIEPQFDGVGVFVEGIAWVSLPKVGGGYIDKKGRYIWKPEER